MKVDLGHTTKVEPCPLCASRAFLHKDHTSFSGGYWVKCDNLQCGCTINTAESQEKALERWNQRLHEISHVSKSDRASASSATPAEVEA